MATMHLLKANFSGKLGSLTGQRWKDVNVIKSAIESRAPINDLQRHSVRAFECLNRISAAIARNWWSDLPLTDRGMLRHNAVARWFKPIVQNHTFDPTQVFSVVPAVEGFYIATAIQPNSTYDITVKLTQEAQVLLPTSYKVHAIAFDEVGNVGGAISFSTVPSSFTLAPVPDAVGRSTVLLFLTYSQLGKKKAGFCTIGGVINMQYSLDEQETGDLWLDGSPIYQRTIIPSVMPVFDPANSPYVASVGSLGPIGLFIGAELLIDCTVNSYAAFGSSAAMFVANISWGIDNPYEITVWVRKDNGEILLRVFTAPGAGYYASTFAYITLRYTRPTTSKGLSESVPVQSKSLSAEIEPVTVAQDQSASESSLSPADDDTAPVTKKTQKRLLNTNKGDA